MREREVKLFLPRFKIAGKTINIREQLIALGMPLPLSAEADFYGINDHRPPDLEALSISDVFHQAFVDVNEKGTEAAAATVVITNVGSAMYTKPPPVEIFRADRPFLFVIRDRKIGAILFLGRVTNPTAEN
jgi:serpin B